MEHLKIILLLGWRNTIRQKRRALVSLLLIFLSTFLLIFMVGMMRGQYGQMFSSAIELYPGPIQITGEGYHDDPSYERLIYDVDEVTGPLSDIESVKEYAVRFETFALYSSGDESAGGMLVGVEPEKEKFFSKIEESLVDGEFIQSTDEKVVYIGVVLANKLNVKVGDELSFISSDIYYSIASDNVTVKGIFKTNVGDFDAMMAFIPKPYFDTLFVSENIASHILILPEDPQSLGKPTRQIKKTLDGSIYQVSTWKDYLQELVSLLEMDRNFGYIMIGMFFTVIFFVIMIFTLISVHTRTKEIGIMRANGTTPNLVAAILFTETTIVSILAIILGGLAGAYVVWYLNTNPYPIEMKEALEVAEQYAELGLQWDPVLKTEFSLFLIFQNMVIIFIMSLVAVVYPILRVNKLKPVEAIAGGKG
ncbi:MAG: FtsX-like permease family protein [Leptospirales bacterium]